MPNAFMGRILWVDLSTRTWREEEVSEALVREYMTGYGLAAKVLFDHMKPGVDPLGPDNILGFAAGLLTGTASFFSGRYVVVGKSPLTGGWGDANSGGTLAPEIKKCGYDGIFFTGKADSPVHFIIDGDKIAIEDASDLWGLNAFETEEKLWTRVGHKKLKVAAIGIAGENLCRMAGIVNDKGRIAARSGLGAVMGSKNLKAVGLRGKGKVAVADRAALKALNKKFNSFIKADSALYPDKPRLGKVLTLAGNHTWKIGMFPRNDALAWKAVLKRYGTMGITAMSAADGDSPVKNWKGSGYRDFPTKRARILSDESVLKHQEKRYGCIACPVRCGGLHKMPDGKPAQGHTHKPEYETLCMLGTLLLIDDLQVIYEANELCNSHGMDTISVGSSIAFAFEAWEKGLIGPEDTAGLELTWGNAKAMLALVDAIAKREGIGDLLAEGVKRAAEKLGKDSESFAIHAGGSELPAHDPRYDPGFAVTFAAEPTPGRHTITSLGFAELQEIDSRFMGKKALFTFAGKRRKAEGKGRLLHLGSVLTQVTNGAGLCLFGVQLGEEMPIFDYLNAATGWDLSEDEWMAAGERIENIRHAFNLREGISLDQTRVAARALGHPPQKSGANAKVELDDETMLREFFAEYGWEYPSGRPERAKLEELRQDDLLAHFYGA